MSAASDRQAVLAAKAAALGDGAYAGSELGYAEGNSAAVLVSANAVDVPGCSISFTSRGRPFFVEAFATAQIGLGTGAAGADNTLGVYITDENGNVLTNWLWRDRLPASGALINPARFGKRFTAPAGTAKTYKLRAKAVTLSANAAQSIQGGNGNGEGLIPMNWIRAVEV